MGKNYWITGDHYGEWYSRFDLPPEADRLKFLEELTRGFIEVCGQEDIHRVMEAGVSPSQAAESYLDSLKEIAIRTGEYPLLGNISTRDQTSINQSTFSTRICYYNREGYLEERDTQHIGQLLRELRPEVMEERPSFAYYPQPVGFIGSRIPLKGIPQSEVFRDIGISIVLRSDIWFPQVVGYLEDYIYDEESLGSGKYDNRELALCHTPRLNHFLQKLRQLTLKLDGTWEVDTADIDYPYSDLLTETGILLE